MARSNSPFIKGLLQKGVIKGKCTSLLFIVHSVHHLSVLEKFLLICNNFNNYLLLFQKCKQAKEHIVHPAMRLASSLHYETP